LYNELTAVLEQAKGTLQDIRAGEGTLGKLVKNNEVYAEALTSLQDMRKMVASVKQNADAIKSLPIIRNYVIDMDKELVRPDCKRVRWCLAEYLVFEPGTAVLTAKGKKYLDEASEWLNTFKDKGTE